MPEQIQAALIGLSGLGKTKRLPDAFDCVRELLNIHAKFSDLLLEHF